MNTQAKLMSPQLVASRSIKAQSEQRLLAILVEFRSDEHSAFCQLCFPHENGALFGLRIPWSS